MKWLLALLTLGLMCLPNTTLIAGNDNNEQFLPIGLTEEEMTRLHEIGINFRPTLPPPGVMRACAEWEPMKGVLIRWPLGISIAIVKEMAEDCIVYTLVANQSEKTSAINAYTSGGVNMANTEFIIAATNSIWTRDYGPWYIFDGNGNVGIVDHIYNRPRPLDDVIPQTLGNLWNIPVYALPLTHTGGNHMCDGIGISMSSRLVYDENPSLTPAQVDQYMLDYLGNDYAVWPYTETSGIHHIDCWAKMLDPATILVKSVAPSDPYYANYNARADSMSRMMSAWGRPYKVVRVYCPTGTAYTNSLILNKKVLVPIFNSAWDDSAINVYRRAMPGYEVLGFTGSWLSDDAIHCRTMGIADEKMLHISHVPLQTTSDTLNDYLVTATVYAHSRGTLIPDSLMILYSPGSGTFLSTPLYATVDPDSFYGYIPHMPYGTEVSYFLKAADDSGKVATHPYIGADWAHRFKVNMVPEISSPDSLVHRVGGGFSYYPQFVDVDDTVHQITYSSYPGWLTVRHDSLVGTVPPGSPVHSFIVAVADAYGGDTQSVRLYPYVCGDADGGGVVDISDAVSLIAYIFAGGAAPVPLQAGDADCKGMVDISDAVHLIAYIFAGGPAPCSGC